MNSSNTDPPSKRLTEVLTKSVSAKLIAETLLDCLHATTVTRNGIVMPDWDARLQAVKILLAYMVGLPTTRKEIVPAQKMKCEDAAGFVERMARYPAVMDGAKQMVARAEARKMAIDAEATRSRTGPRLPETGK